MTETVTIESLGHRGDGIARTAEGPLYVPFTLPGEVVSVERRGERGTLVEVLRPSRERAVPPCRHFGRCGGCALQMMPLAATRVLKRDAVAAALAQHGLHADVAETIAVNPASRRRAVLTALKAGGSVLLGYNERLSNRVIHIEQCAVMSEPLAARLAGIRELLEPFIPAHKFVRVTALITRGGLDISLEGARLPPRQRMPALVTLAEKLGVARISAGGEAFLTLAEPVIEIAGTALIPPPGAFLQASLEAEARMAELVVEHLAPASRVADLFAGVGTFALALARQSHVRAVESSQPALDALALAVRQASGLKRVETERRDLFAFPLAPSELNSFDAVVFDPPRAGAKAQAQSLAESGVARVAAVSCNPASFARDARILVDGGYALVGVVPVDQFVYSADVEVVGLFVRGRA